MPLSHGGFDGPAGGCALICASAGNDHSTTNAAAIGETSFTRALYIPRHPSCSGPEAGGYCDGSVEVARRACAGARAVVGGDGDAAVDSDRAPIVVRPDTGRRAAPYLTLYNPATFRFWRPQKG